MGIDPAKAEIVTVTKESGNSRIDLELEDGSVVQVETVVANVLFLGNDPTNGMPVYSVNTHQVVKLHRVGPSRRKAPLRPSEQGGGAGFA